MMNSLTRNHTAPGTLAAKSGRTWFAFLTMVAANCLLSIACPPTHAQRHAASDASPVTAPTADEIHHWVVALNDDAYAVRQEATQRLLAAGTAARQPLLEVVD